MKNWIQDLIDKEAKKSEKRGIAKGIEQGREQGREQGIEQGIEQGREDLLNKLVKAGLINKEEALKHLDLV